MGESRRLFFGAQIEAPWPDNYPEARIISVEGRHMTLAFLGLCSIPELSKILASVPKPEFKIGPAGIAKELVFLPLDNSRAVALSIEWFDVPSPLEAWGMKLALWLKNNGYPMDERPFFPHVTIGRAPFEKKAWKEQFTPLPLFVKAIHLYQSMGHLEYKSLWEIPLLPPFEEFEHTADIAFHIRGSTPKELHRNAQIALAFHYPRLIDYFTASLQDELDEIIISLNEMIGIADKEYGCPFKAVSFHGKITTDPQTILHWEMIVDV